MSGKQQSAGSKALTFLRNNTVPMMFILICAVCIPVSGFSPSYLLNEIITRLGRNAFLILSLLIPIMAGMGLNFGMTLGAMAGEIALIFVSDWQIWGIPGVVLAMIVSIPFSVLLGWVCGKILNMAKGREMITSYIISFFINGIYQLIVLYLMGSVIPIAHGSIKLPRGYGIRNTVSLLNMRQCIDNLLAIRIEGVKIPVLTLLIIALMCILIVWFRRTKLGQDMRAVGQDMQVARDAGINVERTRIISIIISTVLAGFGMILYLQNIGNLSTYSAHSQVGMFCIAALLVGGASVDRASIGNVFLGVTLFHLMFIVAPQAGAKITGDSMIGEYFRVFVSYGVITLALIMYEMKKRRQKASIGAQLALAQKDDDRHEPGIGAQPSPARKEVERHE
jgi:simple sugar transport system permease protein